MIRPGSPGFPRPRRQYRETPIQKSIVGFLEAALPEDAIHFAIPNEGRRTKAQAALAKAMGLRAGMPDLGVVWCGQAFFLEVKDPRKGVLSKAQNETIPRLRNCGARVAVVYGPEDVERHLRDWGVPLRARVRPQRVTA